MNIENKKNNGYTIHSKKGSSKPKVFQYKRPDGTIATVRMHEGFLQLCQKDLDVFLMNERFSFYATLDARNKWHFLVKFRSWGPYFELSYEIFMDLIARYIYGSEVDLAYLQMFEDEMKSIQYGALYTSFGTFPPINDDVG
ncbi:hypothetical protein [Cohnella thermotolerans]|uniref:hypothetical protein n=1 Tax=Cohnella thermotolerans TaxID=329858 RepID=UPI00047DBB5C|nr:hypothetical protein [Cohnella thermotolerans]